jgi:predicted membrane chloride channel (bestrophin family)
MIVALARRISKEHRIFYRVLPYIAVMILAKLVLHHFEWERLTVNAMFSGLIGATVFLMGFLLSGVLADFKESERIPGEMSAILATLSDEFQSIHQRTCSPHAMAALAHMQDLALTIRRWLHKQERTSAVMGKIAGMNDHFLALESLTQASFLARLKQEQSALRKIIIRIHTIRETDFISSGYFIASSTTILLLVGLALARIEPFYESLFFVVVVSYLLLFLMFLIRDLDNPFGYYEQESSEDVSLKPLEDELADLQARLLVEQHRVDTSTRLSSQE